MLIAIFMFAPIFTYADSIINNNGIEISEEEYNNFIQIHTHEYIMTMNEEQYEKLQSLDYSNIVTETKYIATTYNRSLNIVTEREISEAEYENFLEGGYIENIGGDGLNLSNGAIYYETSAKKLNMVLIGGNIYNYVTLTATWKYIPSTRSFDVIGFRGYGLDFRDGSQSGMQIYIDSSGNYNTINYSWNGTNIKRFSNGFGISMNIVNSSIQALQLIVDCDVSPTMSTPEIFGSYQHAVSSVSLANSQNYTLGGSGLGNVFVYPYNIAQKYDGMSGVSLSY